MHHDRTTQKAPWCQGCMLKPWYGWCQVTKCWHMKRLQSRVCLSLMYIFPATLKLERLSKSSGANWIHQMLKPNLSTLLTHKMFIEQSLLCWSTVVQHVFIFMVSLWSSQKKRKHTQNLPWGYTVDKTGPALISLAGYHDTMCCLKHPLIWFIRKPHFIMRKTVCQIDWVVRFDQTGPPFLSLLSLFPSVTTA